MSNLKFKFVTAPPVAPENNTVYLVRSPAGGDFRFMVKGPEGIAIETTVSKEEFLALSKVDIGLGNVDNTSDVNKPVSTAQQAALDEKAPNNNPAFTGQMIVPEGTSSVPGIAFANDGAPDTGFYHVSDGVFGATANTVPVATFQTAGVELLQTPKAPTAAPGTNTTQIATTAFVLAALSGGNVVHVTTASATAAPKDICSLDFAGVTTLILPLTPSEGTLVIAIVGNGRLDNLIDPNGQTIMGVSGLMTIDKIDFPIQFLFINNTWKIL